MSAEAGDNREAVAAVLLTAALLRKVNNQDKDACVRVRAARGRDFDIVGECSSLYVWPIHTRRTIA